MLPINKLNLEFQEKADPEVLSLINKTNNSLVAIFSGIKGIKINFPNVFNVVGKVSVDRIEQLPPVHVVNFPDLKQSFIDLSNFLAQIQESTVKAMQVKFPDSFKVNNEIQVVDFGELLDGIEELKKGFNLLLKKDFGSGIQDGLMKVEIIKEPPRMVTQPVTNININPLRGTVQTTGVTVQSSSPTPVPGTALANRRTLNIFNNSSVIVYIGGSNVTTTNGIPVGPGTFGPSLDAGPRMLVYGIAASSTADVRVLEAGGEDVGGTY